MVKEPTARLTSAWPAIPLDAVILTLCLLADIGALTNAHDATRTLVAGAGAFLLGLYWLVSTLGRQANGEYGRRAFQFQLSAVLLLVGLAVVLPTLWEMHDRHVTTPSSFIHDSPLQIELATDRLLHGDDYYRDTYFGTPLEHWWHARPGDPPNPALYHTDSLPLQEELTVPALLLARATLGWFDERMIYLLCLGAVLVMALALARTRAARLALVAGLGLNPIFVPTFILGQNDVLALAEVMGVLLLARAKRRRAALLLLGAALATKETTLFLLPFVLLYLAGHEGVRGRSAGDMARWLLGALGWALLPLAVFVGPFLLWDAHAFYESTIGFVEGTAPHPFPIRGLQGYGFASVVLFGHLVPNDSAYWPFGLVQALTAGPIALALLWRQWRDNTLVRAAAGYATTLLVAYYFGRFFHASFIGFALSLVLLAYFMEEGAERVVEAGTERVGGIGAVFAGARQVWVDLGARAARPSLVGRGLNGACDRGRMANKRRLRSGGKRDDVACAAGRRRDDVACAAGLTPRCPSAAMRPRSRVSDSTMSRDALPSTLERQPLYPRRSHLSLDFVLVLLTVPQVVDSPDAPAHALAAALIMGLVALYAVVDVVTDGWTRVAAMSRRAAERNWQLRVGLMVGLLGLLVVRPEVSAIIQRHGAQPWNYVHDTAMQVEEAMRFLLAGKDYYAQTYLHTAMPHWYSSLDMTAALYHTDRPPFGIVGSLPFYLLARATIGWYDQRFVYLPCLILCVVLLLRLPVTRELRLALLCGVLLNPFFVPTLVYGQDDVLILALLLLLGTALYRGRLAWAALWLGLAVATKHTAVFMLPPYLAYVWALQRDTGPWRARLAATLHAAWPALVVPAVIIAPFLLWDARAFLDGNVGFLAGTVPHSYPIRGLGTYGFSAFVLLRGLVPSPNAYYPFTLWEAAMALPLLVVIGAWLWRRPWVRDVFALYALLLFVCYFFSRFFQDSGLAFVTVVLTLGSFLPSVDLQATVSMARPGQRAESLTAADDRSHEGNEAMRRTYV